MTHSTQDYATIAHRHGLLISSQSPDVATLALGGPTGAGLAPGRPRLAQPRRLGRRQVLEERLRHLGRSAAIVDTSDLQDPAAPARQGDHDEISGADPPRGPRRLVVDVDLAAVARRRRLAARLEHPRGPEPLVHTDRIERGLHAETVS